MAARDTVANVTAGTISAVLPLKVSGRHYGENLTRCDLLFATMRRFELAGLFAEILIVVPQDEHALICRHAEGWSDFPINIVVEDTFLDVFREYGKWHQVRPWHRQQIIKLYCAKLVSSPFFLTLDPDVMALRGFSYADLIKDGRALMEPEDRSVHAAWWKASAHLLGLTPSLDSPGMSVTPALLARDICLALFDRLEARHCTPWYRVLLENYGIDWTEYTLYYLEAESSGLLGQRHRLPGKDEPRLLAPYRVWCKADLDTAQLGRLFSAPQRDFFSVIQSNAGVAAADIASLLGAVVPIAMRRPEAMPAKPGQRLQEMTGALVRRMMRPLPKALHR